MRALTLIFSSLLLLITCGCATNASHGTDQDKPEYLTYVKPGDKTPVTQFIDTQGEQYRSKQIKK